MTPLFPAQRAAEEFDQVLGGTATAAVSERYAELLDTVVVLRAQPEVVPRADFVDDLRSRLMTAAETELVAAPAVVRRLEPTRTTRNRRLGTMAAALVIVGGSAGMAAAASGSLPGEALYPVKRGVEQVGTAVRFGNADKGHALLGRATTRLAEVRSLQARGNPEDALVAQTIEAFRSDATSGSDRLFAAYEDGGDPADIQFVRSFAAQQMDVIASLSGTSRPTDDLLVDAADTLADIDSKARALCADCSPEAAVLPPAALSAGAGAATVDHLLSRPVAQAGADIADFDAERLARISRLQKAAEKSAGEIPTAQELADRAEAAKDPELVARETPVVNTLTKDGRLAPVVVSTGAVVTDLLTGVTGTVNSVTGTITQGTLPQDKTPLAPVIKDLTDTVDDTVNGLLP